MVEDGATYNVTRGATFSELELLLPQVSRSHHYLLLNISETVKDTAIVAIEDEYETTSWLPNGTAIRTEWYEWYPWVRGRSM